MSDSEKEAEDVRALLHVLGAYTNKDPDMRSNHVGQPIHLDPDGFTELFKKRIPEGIITLDQEDGSLMDDDPTKRIWLVSYPARKEEDFLKFLDEYGSLHGFSYREKPLKYPR